MVDPRIRDNFNINMVDPRIRDNFNTSKESPSYLRANEVLCYLDTAVEVENLKNKML